MRIIFIILLSIFSISCSTIDARQDNGMGHPYIASEQSIKSAGTYNVVALKLYVLPILITLPATIIDVGVSLVTDTLLLPFDLFIEPEIDNRETTSMDELKI